MVGGTVRRSKRRRKRGVLVAIALLEEAGVGGVGCRRGLAREERSEKTRGSNGVSRPASRRSDANDAGGELSRIWLQVDGSARTCGAIRRPDPPGVAIRPRPGRSGCGFWLRETNWWVSASTGAGGSTGPNNHPCGRVSPRKAAITSRVPPWPIDVIAGLGAGTPRAMPFFPAGRGLPFRAEPMTGLARTIGSQCLVRRRPARVTARGVPGRPALADA